MIVVDDPELEFISKEDRINGVSLILRVKNGEDFLRLCVLSVVDQVDEIIAVFNDSTDHTESILVELEEQYPEKVKVYKYMPIVYPPNSDYYKKNAVKSNDPHSLSHYYNFALAQTMYSHVCKHDDDNLVFPGTFPKLKEKLEKMGNTHAIGLRGINLFDHSEKLYVNKLREYTGGGDTLLFRYDEHCKFVQTINFEKFSSMYKVHHIEVCFYHLKMCKKDRGQNNYDIDTNNSSRYKAIFEGIKLKLIPVDKYNEKSNRPNPFDLGFRCINKSIKQYNYDVFYNCEKEYDKYAKKANI